MRSGVTADQTDSGLGKSINSKLYSIKSIEEAKAYLEDPVLGPRLRTATQALLEIHTKDLTIVFGNLKDVAKFWSSMTLFSQVSTGTYKEFFLRVMKVFWDGRSCQKTLEILESWYR